MTDTRVDAFLGGRLSIRQPVRGYRAGADPVFLAAAVPASHGDRVLELGCGVGTALLCLNARVPGVIATGVERNENYAKLARENLSANGQEARIVTADIRDLPGDVTQESFDHAMLNPPFFDRAEGSQSTEASREAGRGRREGFQTWCDAALKRLRPGGTLTIINRVEGLPETLAALSERAGDIRLLPLQPRRQKPAKLFILNGKKTSKSPFQLRPPLVLHTGDAHLKDGDSYTEEAAGILRKGRALSLWD